MTQLLFILLFIVSTVTSNCPIGTIYGDQFNKCYLYVDSLYSFLAAEQFCIREGGDLVSIKNVFENSYLHNLAVDASRSSFWTGGNLLSSQFWAWSDGSNISYSNWDVAASQQTDPSPNQCVGVKHLEGTWTKELCSNLKPFFCQIASVPNPGTIILPTDKTTQAVPTSPPLCLEDCASSCDSGYIQNAENCQCYKYFNSHVTYNSAIGNCANDGAVLASIKSNKENCWLMKLAVDGGLNYKSYAPWIGLICPGGRVQSCYWLHDNSTLSSTGFINFESGSPKSTFSAIYFDIDNTFSASHDLQGFWSTPQTLAGTGPYLCQKPPVPQKFSAFSSSRQKYESEATADLTRQKNTVIS